STPARRSSIANGSHASACIHWPRTCGWRPRFATGWPRWNRPTELPPPQFTRCCGASVTLQRTNSLPRLHMLLYQMHEFGRAWMAPMTYWADASAKIFGGTNTWLGKLPGADQFAAGCELM